MFDNEQRAFIAINDDRQVCLLPGMANRHGLITGATGTGKTVTLQNLAETFSAMGVPVFAADAKGDLSGVAKTGGNKDSIVNRVENYNLRERGFGFRAYPVQFWDVFGEQGVPVRTTISNMGPLLLSRIMSLNDTQDAVLTLVFRIARDESLPLTDIKDLRKILEYVGGNSASFTTSYGNISAASIGAIQRGLIRLEHDGAEMFFGEPELNIEDFMQMQMGKGVINILAADKLMNSPRLYSTFLVWMMTRLFETLPEVGDPERPKLVFFFDEAHLLFNDAPKALVEKVEQVVRLIRSKGVGIYFVSQSPSDIPDTILAQLGNRIQHALRAYTPRDQKALKAAARSFRANPAFDTETAITELGTGEALVSFLDAKGVPEPVERAFILPPEGQIGPITPQEREAMVSGTILYRHYAQAVDRESAYEILNEKMEAAREQKEQAARDLADAKERKVQEKEEEKARREREKTAREQTKFWGSLAKSVITPVATQVVRSLMSNESKKKK